MVSILYKADRLHSFTTDRIEKWLTSQRVANLHLFYRFFFHQEFKVFLCFTLFVAAASGANVCKCGPEKEAT